MFSPYIEGDKANGGKASRLTRNSSILEAGEHNMESGKKLKKEHFAEQAEIHKPSQGKISSADLPFDLTAELGEVTEAEVKSPGVYYIAAKKNGGIPKRAEAYVVTADAPSISEKARTYGRELPGHPGLRVYDLDRPGSGRYIIDFEIRRYEIKRHLLRDEWEDGESLYLYALYGAEEHPDYFGSYPVPIFTPRGRTIRHKAVMNGVYWLETERCEEMLAVCYPIRQADISVPEQGLGETPAYDRMTGMDDTLGYMFFSKRDSCIALYELSLAHSEIKTGGVVNMPALCNAICALYPEYTAMHNEEVSEYAGRDEDVIRRTPGEGTEFIGF